MHDLSALKNVLPDAWQLKDLREALAKLDAGKPYGQVYEEANGLRKSWAKQGLIRQAERGMTFWQFTN